jgi:cyclophilin family peptidyl-prolyl cis-trans isomerase
VAASGLLVLAALLAGCTTRTGGEPVAGGVGGDAGIAPGEPTSGSSESSAPSESSAGGDCRFAAAPGEPAPAGLPPDEDVPGSRVVLTTGSGEVPIELTPDAAPCTVRSFVHLAGEKFFDGTACHRLTVSAGLKVLQCGDPKGDGTGGPGYTIPDELPTSLPSADSGGSGQEVVTYPRGTVAMANAGPDTGGSQFFLVYGDSTIPPSYTVFGTLDATGLATVDAIAARGVAPGGSSAEDGAPAQRVDITAAAVS